MATYREVWEKERALVVMKRLLMLMEIRLVDGYLPLETQLLVVAREDSVVCENGNHADASSFKFRAIRFHANDTVDYR